MMTALSDAEVHLAKAKEFLEAAELARDLDLYNAATSDAVVSGINSKDAMCLRLTGKTGKGDNHLEAVAELRATGNVGADLAPTLSRLIKLKTKSQYSALNVAASDAAKALDWAERLLNAAQEIVAS